MEFFQLSLLLLFTIIVLSYFWLKQKQQFWSKRNILDVPNSVFFLGLKVHIVFFIKNIYDKYKNCAQPFIGIFSLSLPAIILLDLELIKRVYITDFEYFPGRGLYHNTTHDPLSGNLLRLEGEAWKRLRVKITPTFTTGKMKYMFTTIVAIGDNLREIMDNLLKDGSAELDMLEVCARYTTDIIGSVAFGMECNTLKEPHSEFRKKCDKAFKTFNIFKETAGVKYLKFFQALGVRVFSKEINLFFTKIITENIAYREKYNIKRNDFLDTLIELKNNKLENGDTALSIEEVVAQAFVFFIGGFETSSSTMSFCLFELSHNEEIQQQARKDVLNALSMHNNEFTYESLKSMHYLKLVVMETLRKYPVAPTMKRMCRKNYQVPNTPYVIPQNVAAIIPVYAIHHNPEYYPEPQKFDPMRFTAVEIQKRHPMSYLPFGAGPRICIAERFGKMQTLLGLAVLLKHFKFSVTSETPKEIVFDKKISKTLSAKGAIKLRVEKIH